MAKRKRTAQSLLYGKRIAGSRKPPKPIPAVYQDLTDFLECVASYMIDVQPINKGSGIYYEFLEDETVEWIELIWDNGGTVEKLLIEDAKRQIKPEITEWQFKADYSCNDRYRFSIETGTLTQLLEEVPESELFKLLAKDHPLDPPH